MKGILKPLVQRLLCSLYPSTGFRSATRSLATALILRATWPLAQLLSLLPYRFLGDAPWPWLWSRIGHLAIEPDCFVKEALLASGSRTRGIMLAPANRVANLCLLNYWRQHLTVFTSSIWCRLLWPLAAQPKLRSSTTKYVEAINRAGTFGVIQAGWGDRPPLLKLTDPHRKSGEECLRKLGLPQGSWFVTVHCREGGYDHQNPVNTLRNCDVKDYLPAMRGIVARGGWCLRMGDNTTEPLKAEPGIIDYAHSRLRSDWMDIFLCGGCRFFLGCASGPSAVAMVFGVPCAVTNQCLPLLTQPFGNRDLLVPKLLWSKSLGRYLTFPELAASPLATARFTRCFANTDVQVHDNRPEDICDLVLEMMDELDGTYREDALDQELQAVMRRLIQPNHYSYGAVSRFGRSFLRKYRSLLEVLPPGPPVSGAHPDCSTLYCACLSPRC